MPLGGLEYESPATVVLGECVQSWILVDEDTVKYAAPMKDTVPGCKLPNLNQGQKRRQKLA
jgi:hypothetical protein